MNTVINWQDRKQVIAAAKRKAIRMGEEQVVYYDWSGYSPQGPGAYDIVSYSQYVGDISIREQDVHFITPDEYYK